jgi:hypothetical protein
MVRNWRTLGKKWYRCPTSRDGPTPQKQSCYISLKKLVHENCCMTVSDGTLISAKEQYFHHTRTHTHKEKLLCEN